MSKDVYGVELRGSVPEGVVLSLGVSWCDVLRGGKEVYTEDVLRAAVYEGVSEIPSVLAIDSLVRRVAENVLSDDEYSDLSREVACRLITEAPGELRRDCAVREFVEDVLYPDELRLILKNIGII